MFLFDYLPAEVEFYQPQNDLSVTTPPVSNLLDITPKSWYYLALQSLQERYQINSSTLDNKPLKPLEFAEVFSSFLTAVELKKVTQEDLKIIERLQSDFAEELASLKNRTDVVEQRLNNLAPNQFSTTAKLSGEVIVGLSDDFGELTQDNMVLQQRSRLTFNASFNGKDQFRLSLLQGNFQRFSYLGNVTNEGRLSFDTNSNNNFEVNTLSYRFFVTEKFSIYLAPKADEVRSINEFLSSRGKGSISRFGRKNPIYQLFQDGGLQLSYDLLPAVNLTVGYYGFEDTSRGILTTNYNLFGQLKFEPNEDITLGFMYLYSDNESNLRTGTGSLRSQLNLNQPLVGNSYSLEATINLTPQMVIGGWVGLTEATVIGKGNGQVWNYALTLAFKDIGKKGDLLGLIVGMEPKLTGTSGFLVDGKRRDPNTSLHLEAFYRHQITDNILITPGLIWITAPNHDKNNDPIAIFTTRITFDF